MYRLVFPQWQPPAARPQLQPGRIDIWRIDLTSAVPDSPAAATPAAAQRDAARCAMRRILGDYLDVPDAALRIDTHPGGKPFLVAPGRALEFNLSHSKDIALLAVATGCAVGIDVETYREIDDPLRLARRVMSDEETTQLAALPAARRSELFLDLWTRMEARQKAVGHGIFAGPADPDLLSSFGFRPGERFYACLAVSPASPRLTLRFFDFGRL